MFICACVRVLKRRNSGCGREKEKGGPACENVYIWACVCVCIMLVVWRDCMKDCVNVRVKSVDGLCVYILCVCVCLGVLCVCTQLLFVF